MKKQMAILVGVASLALLTACSNDAADSENSAAPTAEAADAQTVCARYFDGGDDSLATRVTDEIALDVTALTPDETNAFRSTNIQLDAVLLLDGPAELNATIETIKVPFQQADDLATETSTDPIDVSGVADAAATLETQCADAGYTAS